MRCILESVNILHNGTRWNTWDDIGFLLYTLFKGREIRSYAFDIVKRIFFFIVLEKKNRCFLVSHLIKYFGESDIAKSLYCCWKHTVLTYLNISDQEISKHGMVLEIIVLIFLWNLKIFFHLVTASYKFC